MKPLLEWPLWQRALLANATASLGVYLGFASSEAKVSPSAQGYIAVSTFVLINLMFLAVAPRIHAAKAKGESGNPYLLLYQILTERPFVTILFALQLVRVAQAVVASLIFFRVPNSEYFKSTSSVQSIPPFIIYLTGSFMAFIAGLWLLSAIGLWRSRRWGWWLAVVLNALGIVSQLFDLRKFSVDPLSVIATVLLFLPQVRVAFSRAATQVGVA